MNKKRKFVLGAIIAIVFLMIGINLSSNQVTIRSRSGEITIKHHKVKEYNYLKVADKTNPPPSMYKEHLEDTLVYLITHKDDYDKVYGVYGDIKYAIGAEDESLIKYLKYFKDCDEFKDIQLMLSYSDREDVVEKLIKLLDRSMKYNGL